MSKVTKVKGRLMCWHKWSKISHAEWGDSGRSMALHIEIKKCIKCGRETEERTLF